MVRHKSSRGVGFCVGNSVDPCKAVAMNLYVGFNNEFKMVKSKVTIESQPTLLVNTCVAVLLTHYR